MTRSLQIRLKWTLLAGALIAVGPMTAQATTWNDASGDHLWTNGANWIGGVVPVVTAYFDNTQVGTVIVDDAVYVSDIDIRNTTGTLSIVIQPSASLSFRNDMNVGYLVATSRVEIIGGGTLIAGDDASDVLQVGYARISAPVAAYLSVSNVTVDLSARPSFTLGYTVNDSAPIHVAHLDLRHATIKAGAATDTFTISALSLSQRYTESILRLPPAVTNIDISGALFLGSDADAGEQYDLVSAIDLGMNPQLQRLRIGGPVSVAKGNFVYTDGSTSVKGLPPNINAVFEGTTLNLGYADDIENTIDWHGFGSLQANWTTLRLGYDLGNAPEAPHGVLDLGATNTAAYGGAALSAGHVNIPEIQIGAGFGTGILKLDDSMTALSANNLSLAWFRQKNISRLSYVLLGTNSQFQSLVVSNDLRIGIGSFAYLQGSSTNLGFPGGVGVTVGTGPTQRGTLYVGDDLYTIPETRLSGIAFFKAYLTALRIGESLGTRQVYGVLDLRGATNMVLDVAGDVRVGQADDGRGDLYLSAGIAAATNLLVGGSSDNTRGRMTMSNTVFTVHNSVVIGADGLVTNGVYGSSGGFDLATQNLTIGSGAKMHLAFHGDPSARSEDYWGLRLDGDATAVLQALTNSPARLTWDTGTLSTKLQDRFGIIYDAANNRTFVGVQGIAGGTLIWIR